MSSYVGYCGDSRLESREAPLSESQVSGTCPCLYRRGNGQGVSGDLKVICTAVGGWEGHRGNRLAPLLQSCIWTPDFFQGLGPECQRIPWGTCGPHQGARSKLGRRAQVPGGRGFRAGARASLPCHLLP